ncbi:protein zer-1 homolog [Arapaima gigas]
MCLSGEVFLASEVCGRLLNTYVELVLTDSTFEKHDGFCALFSDPYSTRLKWVQLREDLVRDRDLEAIAKQDLIELQLTCCNKLTWRSLKTLTYYRQTLILLSLYGCSNIFCQKGRTTQSLEDQANLGRQVELDFTFHGFNQLRLLNHGGLVLPMDWKETLASLLLYNVEQLEEHIHTIVQLTNLRHLDISRENPMWLQVQAFKKDPDSHCAGPEPPGLTGHLG